MFIDKTPCKDWCQPLSRDQCEKALAACIVSRPVCHRLGLSLLTRHLSGLKQVDCTRFEVLSMTISACQARNKGVVALRSGMNLWLANHDLSLYASWVYLMFSFSFRHRPVHFVFWSKILRSWPLQATGGNYQVSEYISYRVFFCGEQALCLLRFLYPWNLISYIFSGFDHVFGTGQAK